MVSQRDTIIKWTAQRPYFESEYYTSSSQSIHAKNLSLKLLVEK